MIMCDSRDLTLHALCEDEAELLDSAETSISGLLVIQAERRKGRTRDSKSYSGVECVGESFSGGDNLRRREDVRQLSVP